MTAEWTQLATIDDEGGYYLFIDIVDDVVFACVGGTPSYKLVAYRFNGSSYTPIASWTSPGSGGLLHPTQVAVAGNRVCVADAYSPSGRFVFLTWDGSSFGLIKYAGFNGWSVWTDGTYFYCGDFDRDFAAYDLNGNLLATYPVKRVENVFGGNGVIVACSNGSTAAANPFGFYFLTFNGSAFALIDAVTFTYNSTTVTGAYHDGKYYVLHPNDFLRAYSVVGGSLVLNAGIVPDVSGGQVVIHDDGDELILVRASTTPIYDRETLTLKTTPTIRTGLRAMGTKQDANGVYHIPGLLNGLFAYRLHTGLTGDVQFRTDGYSTGLDLPLYGYETSINLEIVHNEREDKTFGIHDNGSTYDTRRCKAKWLVSSTQIPYANDFFSKAVRGRYGSVTLRLITSSGFFPFGPDKGDTGDFTVTVLDYKQSTRLLYPMGYYEIEITMEMLAAPAYSLPSEIDDGDLQIGSITGIEYPQDGFDIDVLYDGVLVSDYGKNSRALDFPSAGDAYNMRATFQGNNTKIAALVDHLVNTVRASNISIVAPANFYLFGSDKSDSGTYVTQPLYSSHGYRAEITIVHESFDRFAVPLSFRYVSHS